MRSDAQRLQDMLEAIERIERYAARGRKAFETDELVQTWVVHHLRILGEASRSVSPEFREAHADFPWAGMTGMRNILVHQYFEMDCDLVWAVVEKDLPELKARIAAALEQGA